MRGCGFKRERGKKKTNVWRRQSVKVHQRRWGRRNGHELNKLLINKELQDCLSWALHACRFNTSSGSHLIPLSQGHAHSLPLWFYAIKPTQFVSSVIALTMIPREVWKKWMRGHQDCRLPTPIFSIFRCPIFLKWNWPVGFLREFMLLSELRFYSSIFFI